MEIFGATICTSWDKQTKNLKDELINHIVGMFGSETFNQTEVQMKVGQHMNIAREQFRVHLERNPRYEHPPMIPTREWKSLVEDGKGKILRKEGNLQSET